MARSHPAPSCIDLVDFLRPLEPGLALPALAVLGARGSGKSCVLEALCGAALPRGNNFTLHLKMKKAKGNEWYGLLKYQTYSHSLFEEERIHHRKDVAETINKVQPWRYLDSGTFILEIISPDVPDLTLIALPSIPSMKGTKPQTVEQIKEHIKKTITNPECMIVVVVPCNVDIATTEALKMAQEVDPDGERTLGLLTKPDIVEKSKEKDIIDVVQNKVIHLKKGFMIVRCYDQTQCMDPIEKECNFFKNHALFSSFYDDGFATLPKLKDRLNKELVQHIEKHLPQLKEYVKKELMQANAELKIFENTPPSDEADKLPFLTDKLSSFTQDVMKLTTGDLLHQSDQQVFSVWRKIVKDSEELFQSKLEAELNLDEQRSDTLDQIKDQIKLLEEPAVFTLNYMSEMVKDELLKLTQKHFFGLSELISKAEGKISAVTSKQQKASESLLRTQFKMEQFEVQAEARISSKKRKNRVNTTRLCSQYQTVYERLVSQIPMMIRFHMIKTLCTELQKQMLHILNEDNASYLLSYDYSLKILREKTQTRFIPLSKADLLLLEL